MRKDHREVIALIPEALKKIIASQTFAVPLQKELERLLIKPIQIKKRCTVPWTKSMVDWVRAFFCFFDTAPSNMKNEFPVKERVIYMNLFLGTDWGETKLREVSKDNELNMNLVEEVYTFKLNRETLFNDMITARNKGWVI